MCEKYCKDCYYGYNVLHEDHYICTRNQKPHYTKTTNSKDGDIELHPCNQNCKITGKPLYHMYWYEVTKSLSCENERLGKEYLFIDHYGNTYEKSTGIRCGKDGKYFKPCHGIHKLPMKLI